MDFRTPPIVIDDSSLKNAAESFTVALTLTLGGYESAIAPKKVTATPTVHERLGPDSWGAEEIDDVNSAYREKRKLVF